MSEQRLCMLGCGNLGTPILSALLSSPNPQFTHYTACVSSSSSHTRLSTLFASHVASEKLSVARETPDITAAISSADVIILAVDPSQVEALVSNPDIKPAFNYFSSNGKLLISVVAGLTVPHLTTLLSPLPPSVSILRAMPNVCALISRSTTTIELPSSSSSFPASHLTTAQTLFSQIGSTHLLPAALIPAATALCGSTPAFWSILVDAMIDAGVAGGMPRKMARDMICQSMRGSAEMMMEGGMEPSGLRDMGTSPAGCTIQGIMVLEDGGVRGVVGRALRESVRVAGEMEGGG